jgi:hypothetical protein
VTNGVKEFRPFGLSEGFAIEFGLLHYWRFMDEPAADRYGIRALAEGAVIDALNEQRPPYEVNIEYGADAIVRFLHASLPELELVTDG